MKIRHLVSLILIAAAPLLSAQSAACCSAPEPRTIVVRGEGMVQAPPDMVQVVLKVNTGSANLMEAKQENDRRIVKVQEVTKSYGIKPEDILIEYNDIERIVNKDPKGERRYVRFVVKKTITILMRELGRFEPLLNELLQAGVNELDEVSFRQSRYQELKAKARELAVKNAQEKATALASNLGRRVGKPMKIVERINYYFGDDEDVSVTTLSNLGYIGNARRNRAPTPETSAGTKQFISEVTVVFELE